MTQQLSPWYTQFWQSCKYFPQGLARGSSNPPSQSGGAAAALISAGIGSVVMMITHHLGDTSPTINDLVWDLGSWIPGSKNPSKMWGNIGSYTGKETMLLVGWLVSWPILYLLWKNLNIKAKNLLFWFFVLMIAATAMCWHPLFPYLPLT